MSIPSVARISAISSTLASLILSFMFNSRYFFPLVLKNLFAGSPLFSIYSKRSSGLGGFSTICIASNVLSLFSSHFFAFLQLLQFGYQYNFKVIYNPPLLYHL